MKRRAVPSLEPHAIPLLALPFVLFADRKRLPRLTAIYFVLNANGTVLYVGQSINLALRWAAHHRLPKLTEHQATRIAWLVMEDLALLNTVEMACIAYFQPCCNGRHAPHPGTVTRRDIPPGLKRLPRNPAYRKRLIYIPVALADALEQEAWKHGYTFNAYLMLIIEQHAATLRRRETTPA